MAARLLQDHGSTTRPPACALQQEARRNLSSNFDILTALLAETKAIHSPPGERTGHSHASCWLSAADTVLGYRPQMHSHSPNRSHLKSAPASRAPAAG